MPKLELPASVRPLHAIAREINLDPNFKGNARVWSTPYIRAMSRLYTISDNFYNDDAESIVRYLLENLKSYRGDTAKRVKAELKAHLAGVRPQ